MFQEKQSVTQVTADGGFVRNFRLKSGARQCVSAHAPERKHSAFGRLGTTYHERTFAAYNTRFAQALQTPKHLQKLSLRERQLFFFANA